MNSLQSTVQPRALGYIHSTLLICALEQISPHCTNVCPTVFIADNILKYAPQMPHLCFMPKLLYVHLWRSIPIHMPNMEFFLSKMKLVSLYTDDDDATAWLYIWVGH